MTENVPSYASDGAITQADFTNLSPRDRVLCSALIIWAGKAIIEESSGQEIDTWEKFCPFIKANYGLEELHRIIDDLYEVKMTCLQALRGRL